MERLSISARPFSIAKSLENTPYGVKKSIKDCVLRDFWGFSAYDEKTVEDYIKEALEWILEAQRAGGCGGIPSAYTLYGGYGYPFPETSGYIITSLLAGYLYFRNELYKKAAIGIADWLVSRQLENGAIRCNLEPSRVTPSGKDKVFLFDCGAILEGLTNIWKETQEKKYKLASIRLADYIISGQGKEGVWESGLFFPYFGSHHARTMWALVNAARAFDRPLYIDSALKCLHQLKNNVQPNGYIKDCHFVQKTGRDFAFTHALAYTVEGFFRVGVALELEEFSRLAVDIVYRLQRLMEIRQELLSAYYDHGWKPVSPYQCVPGNIQVAMMLLEVAQYTGDATLISTAMKSLDLIRRLMIDIGAKTSGIRGGVQASYPILGLYHPYTFTSWGAKFFIDASLLELEALRRIKG